MTESFTCTTCGTVHDGVPLSFAAEFPDMFANMTHDERDARAVIGSDQCIIDREWFFIRGCMEIPIIGSSGVFLWGVWASVSEPVFDEISACWTPQGREKLHGPVKGRLSNSLSVYPPTMNLELRIIIQPVGSRPLFVIEQSEHPLTIEQRSGITCARATELASLVLHQQPGGAHK